MKKRNKEQIIIKQENIEIFQNEIGELYYDFKIIDTGYRETFVRGKLMILPSIRLV